MLQVGGQWRVDLDEVFQWAPTLGGECYNLGLGELESKAIWFQWAPTLGGECYRSVS